MSVYINDEKFEAKPESRLIDIARNNHAHIGYFCGANGICQTCYVKVMEGMDLLSPMSYREKAMLSDRLIDENIRVACLTTLDKPGTIKFLTTVEEVKRMVEKKPQEIIPYQAKMGWESLIRFPETIAMQAQRFFEGKLDTLQLIADVAGAVTGAVELVMMAVQGTLDWGKEKKSFTREYVPSVTDGNNSQNGYPEKTQNDELSEIEVAIKMPEQTPVN